MLTQGAIIKTAREKAGLSQAALAKRVGYATNASISNLEAGKHTLTVEAAVKIANALGLPPAEFLADLSGAADAAA